jgi:hypothetical protein
MRKGLIMTAASVARKMPPPRIARTMVFQRIYEEYQASGRLCSVRCASPPAGAVGPRAESPLTRPRLPVFMGTMWKKLAVLGMIGVAFYVAHVVLGGILWHGYNHLQQPVSDLTGRGAPNRDLMGILTWIYGVCVLIFAVSLLGYFRRVRSGLLTAGLSLYLALFLVSLSYAFFPEDLAGAAPTFTGTMHLVVTFVIVPLTILFPFFVGAGMRRLDGWSGYARYCFVTGVLIFLAGGITAMLFARKLPYFGLAERINLGLLQLWTFMTSLRVVTRKA